MLAEAAEATTDRSEIIAALQQASDGTGSDFHYLLGTAMREMQPETASAIKHFVGRRPVPVRRPDLARPGQGTRRQIWPRLPAPMPSARAPTAVFQWTMPPTGRQFLPCARTRKIAALMEGEFANADPRHAGEHPGPRCLQRRTLCRAFPGTGCGLQADPDERSQAPDARPPRLSRRPPAPTTTSSIQRRRHGQDRARSLQLGAEAAFGIRGGGRNTHYKFARDIPDGRPSALADNSSLLSSVMNWTPHVSRIRLRR